MTAGGTTDDVIRIDPWPRSPVTYMEPLGKASRIHVVVNRALATVALVLSILVLGALVYYGLAVSSALANLGGAGTGSGVEDVPQFDPGEFEGSDLGPDDECWTADDGDPLCAPGGRDGVVDSTYDGE
jgi:hypothetical protein